MFILYEKRVSILIFWLALAISTLVACATPTATPMPTPVTMPTLAATPTPSDSPELAAREWLQALADADALELDDRTCDAQVKGLQNGMLLPILFGEIGEQAKKQDSTTDVSALKLERVNANGDSAQVRVSGRIRSGAGAAVLSEVIDQTWQITRENAKWKFCGHPLLTEKDLPRLVLQPSEVPARLYQAHDGAEAVSGKHTPGIDAELRNAGARAGAYRDYRAQGGASRVFHVPDIARIYSIVYLFDNPDASRRGLSALRNGFNKPGEIQSPNEVLTFLAPLQIGDEDMALATIVYSENKQAVGGYYIYAWRSANVVSVTSIFFESTDESKIRPYAYKMQAHAYSNNAPEILPTPVFEMPSPTDMFSGPTATPMP